TAWQSCCHGAVDLAAWLIERDIDAIAVCGIQTNFCCETTARIGSDLGYDMWFVLDATHTFDDVAPDGELVPAAEIARMTAMNLQGEVGKVVTTAAACAAVGWCGSISCGRTRRRRKRRARRRTGRVVRC